MVKHVHAYMHVSVQGEKSKFNRGSLRWVRSALTIQWQKLGGGREGGETREKIGVPLTIRYRQTCHKIARGYCDGTLKVVLTY